MMLLLIAALVLALVTVTFIFQNTSPVIVYLLIWQFEGSLALILFLTFVFGIIISLLIAIPLLLRGRRNNLKTKRGDEDLLQH